MNQKKLRRMRFLAQYPICCFCGGARATEEIDHVPSRAIFNGRQWPEGFEFPACARCNHATQDDELVVAMLSRLYPDPSTDEEKRRSYALMRGIAERMPEVFVEMKPDLRSLRDAAKKYGLVPEEGETLASLPVLKVSGPLVNQAIGNFSRKLLCALHFKHTGNIVSKTDAMAFKWYSNLQLATEAIPEMLTKLLNRTVEVRRAKTSLDDQFKYFYAVTESNRMSAFLIFFHESFAILGMVNTNADAEVPEGAKVLRPYDWPSEPDAS